MSREDGRDTAEAPLVHRFASSRRDVGANLCTSTGGARTSILPEVTCRLCVAAGSARNFERGELAPASAPPRCLRCRWDGDVLVDTCDEHYRGKHHVECPQAYGGACTRWACGETASSSPFAGTAAPVPYGPDYEVALVPVTDEARQTLVATRRGETVVCETDGGEPEDQSFYRDWKWVPDALRAAYAFGLEDGTRAPVSSIVPHGVLWATHDRRYGTWSTHRSEADARHEAAREPALIDVVEYVPRTGSAQSRACWFPTTTGNPCACCSAALERSEPCAPSVQQPDPLLKSEAPNHNKVWPDCGCEDGTGPYEPSDRGFICPHDPRGVSHNASVTCNCGHPEADHFVEVVCNHCDATCRTEDPIEAKRAAPSSSAVRPLAEWHEDHGPVLWWRFPIVEPPYAGTPLDDDFPEYVTHWTRFETPEDRR